MSELINNRENRQKVLKELIMELHKGKSVEDVKDRFEKLIQGVSPSEISEMEQSLIMEGMPVSEVQRLCDVHAAVFKGSIEDIHKPVPAQDKPGHPVHTFKLENRELERLVDEQIKPAVEAFRDNDSSENIQKILDGLKLLKGIDMHYSRKENLLFPYLEKYGITAPPKVMWGVDDEIREGLKESETMLLNYSGNRDEIIAKLDENLNKVTEMIFKEENILFPMALETLTEDEWLKIAHESDEIGYCLIQPPEKWIPDRAGDGSGALMEHTEPTGGAVRFDTGALTPKEIEAIFNHLPVDITFIDSDDIVKYFSRGKERIFPRTKTVIGRKVQNCHPPASVNVVEKILEDFKSGTKDHEDFWIKMGEITALIRYFAVRDQEGKYMGTLELTQNIKPIQEIKGEKRLLSD